WLCASELTSNDVSVAPMQISAIVKFSPEIDKPNSQAVYKQFISLRFLYAALDFSARLLYRK
ncbi:hypothetical protein, partial [Enterococcus faecalis]|uniref:hypothetical protein n=1 Tax=Enterococcus faecalis TaxID=1351 RepID=UPI0022F11359